MNLKPNPHRRLLRSRAALPLCATQLLASAGAEGQLLNEPIDVSGDFRDLSNTYYLANRLAAFDPATHTGKISYQRAQFSTSLAFNDMFAEIKPVGPNEFPANEYEANPTLPFSIEFVSPKTLRIRITSGPQFAKAMESLMLAGPVPKDDSWKYSRVQGGHRYTSQFGSVTITERPWHIELRDAQGRLLTKTDHTADNNASITPVLPFSFVRRAADYSRSIAAAFTLSPDEKIFGCGESFTALDKRGQKLVLWTEDARGAESRKMYKPSHFS